jgi:hypothetical protein
MTSTGAGRGAHHEAPGVTVQKLMQIRLPQINKLRENSSKSMGKYRQDFVQMHPKIQNLLQMRLAKDDFCGVVSSLCITKTYRSAEQVQFRADFTVKCLVSA